MMEVGKKYKHKCNGSVAECALIEGEQVCMRYKRGLSISIPYFWEELPKEKWAVLMWSDRHKTNIIPINKFFDSQNLAEETWGRSSLFCKVVQIE